MLAAMSRQCADLYGDLHPYLPAGTGVAVQLRSIDVNPYTYQHQITGPQYETRWVRLAEVPEGVQLSRGDAFVIGGVTYKVTDIKSDGGDGAYLVTDRMRVA